MRGKLAAAACGILLIGAADGAALQAAEKATATILATATSTATATESTRTTAVEQSEAGTAAAAGAGLVRDFDASSLIRTDGTYWVWGGEHRSVPTEVVGATDVAASFDERYFMKTDGSVWRWTSAPNAPAIAVAPVEGVRHVRGAMYGGAAGNILLGENGALYRHPVDGSEQVSEIPGIDRVTAMTSYYDFEAEDTIHLFLKRNGTVWGSVSPFDTFAQVRGLQRIVAIEQNAALREDGTVWTWSNEGTGQSGAMKRTIEAIEPSKIEGLEGIRSMTSNRNGYAGVDREGRVWFWGETVTGHSDGTVYHAQSPVRIETLSDVREAYLVERSLLALTTEGSVYDTSIEGERMPSDPAFRVIAEEVVRIEPGGRHVILLQRSGELWGYGINKGANLGHGDYEISYAYPVQVHRPVQVRLNGEPVAMLNGAIMRNGQAFIPLRSIFEQLGAKVTWDAATRTAVVSRPESAGEPAVTITIRYKTGELQLNGETVALENAPFTNATSAYLPLRFITEQLGAKVAWDAERQRIAITMA